MEMDQSMWHSMIDLHTFGKIGLSGFIIYYIIMYPGKIERLLTTTNPSSMAHPSQKLITLNGRSSSQPQALSAQTETEQNNLT